MSNCFRNTPINRMKHFNMQCDGLVSYISLLFGHAHLSQDEIPNDMKTWKPQNLIRFGKFDWNLLSSIHLVYFSFDLLFIYLFISFLTFYDILREIFWYHRKCFTGNWVGNHENVIKEWATSQQNEGDHI